MADRATVPGCRPSHLVSRHSKAQQLAHNVAVICAAVADVPQASEASLLPAAAAACMPALPQHLPCMRR